jgi:hypothetical protein
MSRRFLQARQATTSNGPMILSMTVRLCTCGVLLLATAAYAQSKFEEDFDDQDKPWQEIAVQLPAPNQPDDLLPFTLGPTSTYRFAIDAKSLSVGPDGVVRYTLVATSPAGARNVSYEGIRCQSYEHKLYAFGQPDGTWSRSRRDQWERINSYASNSPQASLFKDYFCDGKVAAGKAEEMVDRLRYKRPLSAQPGN